MSVGDVYQVLDKQTYGSQDVLNVYYYQSNSDNLTAEDIATLFGDTVISQVILIQTTVMQHEAIEVINLDDPTDFFEEILSPATAGTIGSASMPSYVSWTFKLVRSNRTVRNGRKAICGVAESATANNVPEASAVEELEDTADVFAALLDDGGGNTATPVIYGKPTPAPSSLPLRIVPISGGEFTHISSQNTRKFF